MVLMNDFSSFVLIMVSLSSALYVLNALYGCCVCVFFFNFATSDLETQYFHCTYFKLKYKRHKALFYSISIYNFIWEFLGLYKFSEKIVVNRYPIKS